MCGISGIVSYQDVNSLLYEALTVLQHRGQDAAGIATCSNDRFFLRKANGLVRDVFQAVHMQRLKGDMGIGHVRYPTAGSLSAAEAQPFYVNSPYGIMLAHNGNLTNDKALRKELYHTDRRHLNTSSDSEVLLNILAHELYRQPHSSSLTPDHIFKALSALYKRCKGGYAAVALINGHGLLAFRDPHGIRPLVLGKRQSGHKVEYMVASESVALDCTGFSFVRDIEPGEAIFIDKDRQFHSKVCAQKVSLNPCLFEYVYMARPDSVIDGISVYEARVAMGETLADKISREWRNQDIDVVMPIPDSSRASAMKLASCLGLPYREGLVKNRYIGRTFIMPGQEVRHHSVRRKLNVIANEFKGKSVLLVDDSIVRGTTCRQIIDMARESGAKKVYFCSAAPAVKHPNVYGIDMPVANELIAHNRTTEEICTQIGADALIYQDLDAMVSSILKINPKIKRMESAVFDGDYITGDINTDFLEKLAKRRSDQAKKQTVLAL